MKDIKEYINEHKVNEHHFDFDVEDVATAMLDAASEVLGKKIKTSSAEDIDAAALVGDYSDYDKVAELLNCDSDELYDFIGDNWQEISKLIDKLKKQY